MKTPFIMSSLLAFMSLAAVVRADPAPLPAPKLISPAAGSKVPLGGGGFTVKFERYPGALSYGCAIDQAPFGGGQWMHYDGADTSPTPECVISAAEMAKQFKPGRANLTLYANVGSGMDLRVALNELPLEIVFVAPTSTRPATPWDSTYRAIRNTSNDGTVLACPKDDSIYVVGGQFSFDLPVGANGGATGGGAKKKPGASAGDTSAASKGGGSKLRGADDAGSDNIVHLSATMSPDGKFSAVIALSPANLAAARTRASFPANATTLTMTGGFRKEDTSWQKNPGRPLYGKGRVAAVKLSVTGADADTGCSFSMTSADYDFHAVDPGSFGSGGTHDAPRSGAGGGGGADACKNACQHAEATCTSSRGDCMKTRQSCVNRCN